MYNINHFEIKDIEMIKLIRFANYKYFNNLFVKLTDSSFAEYVDTRNAILMINTFANLTECKNLYRWDTSKVISLKSCFSFCRHIESYEGISKWNLSSLISLDRTFSWNINIRSFKSLSSWRFTNLLYLSHTFSNDKSLIDLEGISEWNVDSVVDFSYAFHGCSSLTNLKGLEHWHVNPNANFTRMFLNCYELTDCSAIDNWNLTKNYEGIFNGCNNITRYPIWYDKNNDKVDKFDSFRTLPEEKEFYQIREKFYRDNVVKKYESLKRSFAQVL